MQYPTPPTKPTPPTPPSMKTSTAVPTTDTHTPGATTTQSITPAITAPPSKEQSTSIPASVSDATKSLAPSTSVSTTSNTSTETTSEKALPPTPSSSKSNSTSTFSTFFVLISIIAIAIVTVHWWKNYKPKQKSIVDYSTESPNDIVNLILSESTFEPTPQGIPKTAAKKVLPNTQPGPNAKSGFEVRI